MISAARPRISELRRPAIQKRSRSFAIFTTIEGILVDGTGAVPAAVCAFANRLRTAQIPVVPISSMTIDQLSIVSSSLAMRDVAVVESGGAIARWDGRRWKPEPCGPGTETLLEAVREVEDRSGASLLVYSALADEEASRLSGLKGEMLRASKNRRFSEPFIVERGDGDAVSAAASAIGFRVRRGRDFMHLVAGPDEAEAFARVRDEIRARAAIAVGSSAADAGFLQQADVAVIIPRADGTPDPDLLKSVPVARVAGAPGASGWIRAIEEVWRELGSAPPLYGMP